MLKDLDERQNDVHPASGKAIPVMQQSSSHKNLIVIVVILVLLNIIGFLAWKVYQNSVEASSIQSKPPETVITQPEPQKALPVEASKVVPVNQPIAVATPSLTHEKVLASNNVPLKSSKQVEAKNLQTEPNISENLTDKPRTLEQVPQPHTHQPQVATPREPPKAKENKPADSSFSISRKHFSAKELIAQKVKRAEKAIDNNNISEAEILLEDVLLLDPKQQASRKMLASLWFGRESYQDAVNLLAQGIRLDPNDIEFRLMQARIYLSKGRPEKAFMSLKAYTETNNVEYLALLAGLAQQLNELPVAIIAYKRLTASQPHVGKWWLGLAVSHDKQSEFKLASFAYKSAIAQDDLSKGSNDFARNRIIELGE